MKKYAILANPGHNRIYFDTAMKIAVSELSAITESNGINIKVIDEEIQGLPESLCFESDRELDQDDFKLIGASSIYYAIFEIIEGNLLKPIVVPDFHTFPESMVQILKYSGKTNEQFTRLMVNLAISACKTRTEKLVLLDPMCGKGTTLYEGFIRGLDVKGIEINEQWVQEIQTYVVRYMKEGRYKHKASKSRRSDERGRKLANVFTLEAASTKESFAAGDIQTMELFCADTRKTGKILKKKSCDIIVSDLPYGVQHGSKSDTDVKMSRSPLDLLKSCLPSWSEVLKTKGSIVLSFNEFTMKYIEVAAALEKNGFRVLEDYPYNNYIHRVDQSINRNVIVAVKM